MSVHRLKNRPPQGEKVMSGEAIGRIGCVSCESSVYLAAYGNEAVRTGFRNDMAELASDLDVPVFVRTSPTDVAEFGPEQENNACRSCSMAGQTLAVRAYVELIVTK